MTRKRCVHGRSPEAIGRRTFLASAAALAAPLIIPAEVLGRGGRAAPSEAIRLGVIGTGGRGTTDMIGAMESPLCRVVALCDPRRPRLLDAKKKVDGAYGKEGSEGCGTHRDFRELLDRKDVDAVIIAPPDHWHGIIATRALKAGKDVYCEKPLGRTIAESIAIRDAAVKGNRIFQTGTQQRSDPLFRKACALARGGHLGKVRTIEVAVPAGGGIPVQPAAPVPDGFDYDLWSGPAPLHPFDARRCEWLGMYWILDYCVGFICNWGIHHLDIAAWGCPEVAEAPFEVDGTGFLPSEGMCDTLVTWRNEFRFPSGLRMSFTSDRGPFDWQKGEGLTAESRRVLEAVDPALHHPIGCRFIGSEGWVHVTRGDISAEPAALLEKEIDPAASGIVASDHHQKNFLEAVRDRKEPVSPVGSGHRATILGNAADIAIRVGKKLRWDPKAERFDDAEANRRLSAPMREPWKI